MSTVDDTLPLRGGCWVMRGSGTSIEIAKVKACYRLQEEVLLDLWMYSREGDKIGRTSPVEGGPRSFEPACALEGWVRIVAPDFPLEMAWVPSEKEGWSTPGFKGTKVIPFGAFKPRRKKEKALAIPSSTDYDPALEVYARRMAAQEMRDLSTLR